MYRSDTISFLAFIGTPSGVFTATSCLPSCARLSRARTLTVHRTVRPLHLFFQRAARRFDRQNGAVSSFPAESRELSHGIFRQIKDLGIGLQAANEVSRSERSERWVRTLCKLCTKKQSIFLILCLSLVHHQGFSQPLRACRPALGSAVLRH